MKPRTILGGMIIAGAAVSAGSTALGAAARKLQQHKQTSEITQNLNQNFVGTKNIKPKYTYLNTLDSLTLNAQYQKVYLQSLNSIKKSSYKIMTV